MAMYMLMAKYSAAALKGIIEKSSDREAVARQAIEAAGGKLHGFYGMFGQEYGLAMIIEAPGHAEYIGGLMPAIGAGTSRTTLSVSKSTRFSSRATASPGCLCHPTSVASATDSGSCGTRTSIVMILS